MFENTLKRLHGSGKPMLNGWLSVASPLTAEIMARQGYDAVTIDMQHGAIGYGDLLPMILALNAHRVTPMVRVPALEPGIIMKSLDLGAQGIICPLIDTPEQAAQFVSCLRYPPTGQRSYGPTRAAFAYGGYDLRANDQILGFAMIETARGVENLEAIAATPGLDGIYIGPSDLAIGTQGGRASPGFDRSEPELQVLIRQIMTTAQRHGLIAALHCGEAAYAAQAVHWGFDMTTVSGDTRLLAAAAARSVQDWRTGVAAEEGGASVPLAGY